MNVIYKFVCTSYLPLFTCCCFLPSFSFLSAKHIVNSALASNKQFPGQPYTYFPWLRGKCLLTGFLVILSWLTQNSTRWEGSLCFCSCSVTVICWKAACLVKSCSFMFELVTHNVSQHRKWHKTVIPHEITMVECLRETVRSSCLLLLYWRQSAASCWHTAICKHLKGWVCLQSLPFN